MKGIRDLLARTLLGHPLTVFMMTGLATFCPGALFDEEAVRKDRLKVEALMRLSNVDVNRDEKLHATVLRYLDAQGDDPQQLRVIRQLKPSGTGARLLDLVSAWEEKGKTTEALQAIELVLNQDADLLQKRLMIEEPTDKELRVARVLALCDNPNAFRVCSSLLEQESLDPQIRQNASMGLARFPEGQKMLLAWARENKLWPDVRYMVGVALKNSQDPAIREEAIALFPSKKSASVELPSIDELCKKRGDVDRGKLLFDGVATCNQCHTVKGSGKNVGPDLTEIGSKLSREAMYLAILDPSAGISHNYESYAALLDSGVVVVGLLVSRTDETMVLKDAQGIERTIDAEAVEEWKKLEKSLMPDNLQETMSVDGLVDLVEYLMSLQKPSN